MNPLNAISEFVRYATYPVRMLTRIPASIISAPGRFLGMSLPTRAALAVWIVLFLISIGYIVLRFLFEEHRPDWTIIVLWVLLAQLLILLVALIVRYLVRLWLEKDLSRFPEIDEAWQAGMAALHQEGINILDTPVFLVLGVANRAEADTIIGTTGVSFSVSSVPNDQGWLHWYAHEKAIFIVATRTCRLGGLKSKLVESGDVRDHSSDLIRQTINPDRDIRGTVGFAPEKDERAAIRSRMAPTPNSAEPNIQGTMLFGQGVAGPDGTSVAGSPGKAAHLSGEEGVELTERLEYLCRKLVRERQPVCPCNGILTLLPFEIIKRGPAEAVEVQKAARADLEAIRRQLKLRCQVVALVSGMETESGFRELVRRVGANRAKRQRVGHKFGVWNPPIPDQIEALAANACKAFEDITYELFKEKDGLTQYGNRKLYSLLCCVRSTLRTRLTNTLVAAFADESDSVYGSGESLLFGGCYFAATGDTEDRQAFVKSVVEKLYENGVDGELEWSRQALKEDQRFHQIAQIGLVIDGALFLAVAGLLWKLFV